MASTYRHKPPRTVLEQLIRRWRMTQEQFVAYTEQFAREQGEHGTLGVRHLQRLVAGRAPDGAPLGRLQPDTARLLERVCKMSVDELLAPPHREDNQQELRDRIRAATRVDASTVGILHDQLANLRRLDRELGAPFAHPEVRCKLDQVTQLRRHSIAPRTREPLATLFAELATLAAWQSLDMGRLEDAWKHYDRAKAAANEVADPTFHIHTSAEQSFVLLDLGERTTAVELLGGLRANAACGPLLQAWLTAAHGEALAADGQRSASLRAFDHAEALLPTEVNTDGGPFVVLDSVHLARWRGHALARIGEPEAIEVLTDALEQLDPSFTRAATALHVDLATAFIRQRDTDNARDYAERAARDASGIGSQRQLRRLEQLTTELH